MLPATNVHQRLGALHDVLINRIWAGLLVIALIGVPISLMRISDTGWLPMYAVHLGLGISLLALYGLKQRIKTTIKAVLTIALFWMIGAAGLTTLGLLGAGTWWLVTSALLVNTFYSSRAGLITIALVCATVIATGIGFNTGVLQLGFDANAYIASPAAWATLIIATVILPLVVFTAISELNRTTIALAHEVDAQREEIRLLATTDELTGIPRQTIALDRLQQALLGIDRQGSKVAVYFLDLDGFKAINDQYGHEAGDAVLCVMAKRWRACLRDSDTLARKGGDEFIAVLQGIPSVNTALDIANKLVDACDQAVDFQGHALRVGCSIGVAVSPDHALSAQSLIRAADMAMYKAKNAGKHCVRLAKPETLSLVVNRAS